MFTKGDWRAFRFSSHHNWKVDIQRGGDNEFLDLGQDADSEANARLIAQSPRMADLLLRLVNDGWNASISEEAMEILDKAEGKDV